MTTLTTTLHSYYNSGTYKTTYEKFGSGSTKLEASTNAKNSVSSALDGIYASIGTASTAQESTQKIFGIECGSVNKEAVAVQSHGIAANTGLWGATAIQTGSRTSKAWQLSAEFAITGLTASTIKTATLNITAKSNSTSPQTFRICAPKSSTKPGKYWRTTDSNAPINFNIYKEFTSKNNTNSNVYSIDILDIFKECINKGAGWISILYYGDTPYGTRELTVSELTLDYTLTTSKCTAPTSITVNSSIAKPTGSITLSWSGAKAGTNNAIKGYKIYYKIADNRESSSMPTTSSTCIDLSSSTATNYTFSFSDATRGKYYNFKILTVGTASGYNSDLSSTYTFFRINSLPAAPTFTSPSGTSATVTEPLSTSTATNITFSDISAGTDSNSQTRTVYYSLGDGSKIKLTGNSLSLRLTQTTVVHFYTYDSLEYSAAKNFTVNVSNRAPTISSLTTSAASTYTPVTAVSNRTAAYKINATADVTHGSRSITYKWQAVWATAADGNSFSNTVTLSSGTLTSDKTQISLSNFDITTKITNLNRSYKIKLEITDSGVSQDGTVSNTNSTIYYLTAYPTVSWFNQFADSSISESGLEAKFGSKIRIKLSKNKGSLVTDLYYATSSSGTKTSYKSLTAAQTSDVTIDSDTKFPRGQTRYFYVKFSLGNACNYSPEKTYTRAGNLAPSSVTLVSDGNTASGKIYPYTDSKITIQFPKTNLSNEIYTRTFKIKGTTEKSITDPVVKEGTATTTSSIYTIDLTKITTKFWADLFNLGTTAPYTNDKKITVLVTITNKFGETFSTRSSEYTLYFKSGFQKAPTIKVQLWSSGSTPYYDIIGYDSSNRYPLKQGQYIRFLISGIECYTNQKIIITVEDSSGLISFNSKAITPTTANMEATPAPAKYTTGNVTFEATIPQIQSAVVDLTYTVTVTSNGVGLKSNNPNTTDETIKKFVNIKYSRTYPQIVDFNFTSVKKDQNDKNFTLGYKITEYGTAAFNNGGGSIKLHAFYATSSTGNPEEGTTTSSLITINNPGNEQPGQTIIYTPNGVNADIIYFGIYYYIQNTLAPATKGNANTVPGYGTAANGKRNYTKIPQKPFSGSSDTDTASYIYKKALIKYYNKTPNLLYGKNFFVMNATKPRSEKNLLLEINSAGYLDGSTTTTRDTIYIGKGDTAGTFKIDDKNGLIVDCGTW